MALPYKLMGRKMLGSIEDITQLHTFEQCDDAFDALHGLHKLGVPILQHMVQCVLHDCSEKKTLAVGRRVHAIMISSGLDSVSVLGDHIIRLFGSFGSMLEADLMFCSAATPSVYTWHAIISVHVHHGECEKALELYIQMQESHMVANKYILICILKACGKLQSLEHCERVHVDIMSFGFDTDVFVGSSLVDSYAKCGCLPHARKVFDILPNRNIVSWHAMMTGYAEHGQNDLVFQLFGEMHKEIVQPNKVTYLCALKACSSSATLQQGKLIHAEVITSALESDMMIANTLIDMYAKCGSIDEACQVFENLPSRDPVSWCALIAGCALQKHGIRALKLFERMMQEGLSANRVLLLCILKVCVDLGALIEGKLVHDVIIRNGSVMELDVENTVLDMYAKCGCLEEAYQVFERLPSPNIVSWGAMISGCSQNGHESWALELYQSMKQAGMRPNPFIFSCVLKACGNLKALQQGMLVHESVIRDDSISDQAVGNALVDMYSKCGSLEEGQKVFQGLPTRNNVSWSVMIAGYAQNEHSSNAITLFERMQEEGIEPNEVTYLSVLKACESARAPISGESVHVKIIKNGFESNMAIANTLVHMYCKCDNLEAAREVFNKILNPDDITWNAMIAGYAQCGLDVEAMELFERMQREGRKPHEFTFPCILKVCGSLGACGQVRVLHDKVMKLGLISDVIVVSALVDAYVKCGSFEEAHRVFDVSTHLNEVSWGVMIAGCVHHGHHCLALELFEKMPQSNLKPDSATLSCILKACANMGVLGQGHLIHEIIIRSGLDADSMLGSSLVDMYAKSGSLDEARKVFEDLPDPDVVLWGAMIAGYAEKGLVVSAMDLFHKMQQHGLKPNNVVFLSIVKACSTVGEIEHGKYIHDQIIQTGLESDSLVGNTLVDMYSKSGKLDEALLVFEELSDRDVVSWSVMISGYSELGDGFSALQFFERMQQEGIDPGKVSFLSVLKACAGFGYLKQGRLIHHQVIKGGLESDAEIGNTLTNMYSRCGNLEEARKVFDQMPCHKEASWSVLIAGCGHSGNSELAQLCVGDMQEEGLRPHGIMSSSIISACSHLGQVDEGQNHFAAMQEVYYVMPSIEHCNSIVDLLARAGRLKHAEQFLQTMPVSSDLTGWMSLLTSCKTYGSAEIGRRCFDSVMQIDPDAAAGYVLMCKIYAGAQMWKEFQEVQGLRKGRSAWKKPGWAWIEVGNCTNTFVVGGNYRTEFIMLSNYIDGLARVMKGEGYVPCVDVSVDQINNENADV